MPFTVENGTGIAAANSFVAVASFKDYCDLRGYSYAGKSDTQIQQSLVSATDYLERVYQYKGAREFVAQGLSFPRVGIYREDGWPIDGIPAEIVNACCELANRHLGGVNLFVTPSTSTTTGHPSKVTEDRVGPLSRRREYAVSSSAQTPTTQVVFTDIDMMLRILTDGGSVVKLERA